MEFIRVKIGGKLISIWRLLILMVVMLVTVVFAEATDKQNWRYHPSFDCTPVKIIDTKEYTYFLVHQQIFNKSIGCYDSPSLTVFFQDKQGECNEIQPLADIADISSFDIRIVEYSQSLNSLIIGYNSGSIDIVSPEGNVKSINKRAIGTYPGENRIGRIISPCYSNDIIVCNEVGYTVIDGIDGCVKFESFLGKSVDAVFPISGKTIMFSENCLYLADDIFPENLSEYKPIPNISSVLWVAPLDERSFVLVRGIAGGNGELLTATLQEEGSLAFTSLCQDQFVAKSDNESVVSRYEGNFIQNRDGYLFYSKSKVWQLLRNENEFWAVKSIPLDRPDSPIGSWDFNTFLTYADRGMFLKRLAPSINSNLEWVNDGEGIRPKAPSVFISTKMDFTSEYGLLLANHGAEQLFPNMSVVTPSLLTSWNGKEWISHSHSYMSEPPRKIRENEKFLSLWNSYKNRYPVSDPTGICVDPMCPDMAIIPSTFGGVIFQNLKQPEEVPIRICSPTDPLASLPGSMPVMRDQNWTSFCSMSAPKFDAASTLWLTYLNFAGSEGKGEGKILLKYFSKEKRRELYKTPIEALPDSDVFGTINIPYYQSPNGFSAVLPFIHADSKNYVVADLQSWNKGLYIVNHKGSLEDCSDDEIKWVQGYITSDGRKIDFIRDWAIVEDPVNGNVIVSYYNGLATFHPSSAVTHDGYIIGEDISVLKSGERVIPSICQVNNIIFDTVGRMWIATNNQGVVCISADRKSVEYRLTAETTPLPTDKVYGIGWNPQTHSLMISTHLGLVEFTPDITTPDSENKDVIIYPNRILPDYSETVCFRNLSVGSTITVRDKKGKEVIQLHSGSSPVLTWDLKDNSGKRLPSGVYKIDIDGTVNPLELIILSPR